MACYSIDGVIPVIHPSSFIHPMATIIGDVIIGARCYVAPAAVLRGDFGRLVLHDGVNVQDGCVMHGFPDTDTTIEHDGHIGHGAILHGCTVRRNALVGMNAVVMDGAVIGEAAIVAANSFVRSGHEVPDRHLVAGTPAKLVRPLTDEEIEWKEQGTRDYQQLTERSFASMKEVEPLPKTEHNRPRLKVAESIPLHLARQKTE